MAQIATTNGLAYATHGIDASNRPVRFDFHHHAAPKENLELKPGWRWTVWQMTAWRTRRCPPCPHYFRSWKYRCLPATGICTLNTSPLVATLLVTWVQEIAGRFVAATSV